MTPAVIAMLAVVVLPLLLLLLDLVVRRSATKPEPVLAAPGAPQPARFSAASITAPAPSGLPGRTPGAIRPGEGMVYRGPAAARR